MATSRSKGTTKSRRGRSAGGGSAGTRGRSTASRSTTKRRTSAAAATARRQTSSRGSASGQSRTTTDHDEIRRWAEERGARPACVLGTGGGGDEGVLRLDFPGYSGGQSLQPISWEEWFEKFDEANLALLYQEQTKGGQRSNFNKLVDRNEAQSSRGRARAR